MAWRISAGGEHLLRTAALPSTTNFSVCGWQYTLQRSPATTYGNIWDLEDTTYPSDSSAWIGLVYNDALPSLRLTTTGGGTDFASAPSDNAWFFWALTCSGTGAGTFIGYWVAASGAAFVSANQAGVSFAPGSMLWGEDTFDAWVDGRIAGVKVWDAVLTSAELWSERWSLTPVRRANLHLFAPGFRHTDLEDMSGNGKTLTAGGTLSTEEGPPVPWRTSRARRSIAIAAAAGDTFIEGLSRIEQGMKAATAAGMGGVLIE